MMMSAHDMQTFAGVDVPQATGEIIAATCDFVPTHVDAPHAFFVPLEHPQTFAVLDIPDTQRPVARARDGYRAVVQDLEATDGRGVTFERIYAEPMQQMRCSRVKRSFVTHPDLTSHTLRSLSQPPLTASACGCPQPSDVPEGSLGRPCGHDRSPDFFGGIGSCAGN